MENLLLQNKYVARNAAELEGPYRFGSARTPEDRQNKQTLRKGAGAKNAAQNETPGKMSGPVPPAVFLAASLCLSRMEFSIQPDGNAVRAGKIQMKAGGESVTLSVW